eukprot:11580846-Alexandrium_andersonii.AAC.1
MLSHWAASGEARFRASKVKAGPHVLEWAADSAKADISFVVEAMRLHGDAVLQYPSTEPVNTAVRAG